MSQTSTDELIIYYNKDREDIWFRVDGKVDKDDMPSGDDPPESKLFSFTVSFKDPVDYNGDYFTMTNGDDIAVVETTENLAIVDDIKCGVITKTIIKPKGRVDNRWSREFSLVVENRDFSVHPFVMGFASFADQGIIQDLIDVLEFIFYGVDENGNCFTRDDLGGILSDGTVIRKYKLLSDTTDVGIVDTALGARETLNEYIDAIGYRWRSIYYVESDPINAIHPIQQIEIWQGT